MAFGIAKRPLKNNLDRRCGNRHFPRVKRPESIIARLLEAMGHSVVRPATMTEYTDC